MDMVTMNIIDSSVVSACREMGITLMKTSYSTIFNEALDFTCALADADGDMMAVAEIFPAQIGDMPLCIRPCAQEIPFHELDEGDVIVRNELYRSGLHTPEHTFFKPVFVTGETGSGSGPRGPGGRVYIAGERRDGLRLFQRGR